jgi:hypothetical protein
LNEDYKSKVKLNVWALRDEMSAVRLSNCENVQEYASKIQRYVNDFNLCADSHSSTGSGIMPKSEHSYYLMKGIPKDEDWRFFTQLMYDKIDTLVVKPEEVSVKMTAHEARSQNDQDSEGAAILSKLLTTSNTRSHTPGSRKSRDSGSKSESSNSDDQKKHRHRRTQECYRYHQVRHIA